MGKDQTTVQTSQQQQAEPTPEERELNRLSLERVRAAQPGTLALQQQALGLGQDLFSGLQTGQSSSPILNRVMAGISPEVTNRLVQQSIGDVQAGLQASGLLDSGVRAELETETAAGIRAAAEESNLNTLFNLLNISQGQAAQIQSPLLAQSGQLGSQLAGLRSINSSGSQMTTSMNPFLKSFQTNLGQSLGSPQFSAGPFTFGG